MKIIAIITSLIAAILASSQNDEVCPEANSSRWRENLHHYIEEMEDLTRRKPGYKATMNTYAPCRPIMENLQCVRSNQGTVCDLTLHTHVNYRGSFLADTIKPSQWNPIGKRCFIKFDSQPELYNTRIVWSTIRNECVPWKSYHSPNFVQPVDPGITIRDYPDYEDSPESPESYQDCFKYYFYTTDDKPMTEDDCISAVRVKLFPTVKTTTTTTEKKASTIETPMQKKTTTRKLTTTSTTTTSTTTTSTTTSSTTTTSTTTTSTTTTSSTLTSTTTTTPTTTTTSTTTTTTRTTTTSKINTEVPATSTTTTSTKSVTSLEVIPLPEGKTSDEDHPIMPDNSVLSYVADIDSVFLPFTEYAGSSTKIKSTTTEMAPARTQKTDIRQVQTRRKKCSFENGLRVCSCKNPKYAYDHSMRKCTRLTRRKVTVAKWSKWSKWSQCSATCGEGTRSRSRKCKKRRRLSTTCDGDNVETKSCTVALSCESVTAQLEHYAATQRWRGRKVSGWSRPSACSATCGGGVKSKT